MGSILTSVPYDFVVLAMVEKKEEYLFVILLWSKVESCEIGKVWCFLVQQGKVGFHDSWADQLMEVH